MLWLYHISPNSVNVTWLYTKQCGGKTKSSGNLSLETDLARSKLKISHYSMNKSTTKLFNLPEGLWATAVVKNDVEAVVTCRSLKHYAICPWCEAKTKKVNQYRLRRLKHGRIDNRNVVLEWKCRQFICRNHLRPRTFMETIPGIDRRRHTPNFRTLTLPWLQRNSFNFTGEMFSLSPSALNRLSRQSREDWRIDWNGLVKDGITLGIDEHSYRGRDMVLTITELRRRKLLDILPDDSQATLAQWLENMPTIAKKAIGEVCMDLKASYKHAVEKALPHAKITADRFHVEQLANRLVDQIRAVVTASEPRRMNIKHVLLKGREKLTKTEQKKLVAAFIKYQRFPTLYHAWFIKEKIRALYRLKDKKKARKEFAHILTLIVDADFSHYFGPFKKTLIAWQENILNYFDSRTTNAFTEGVHTKIKLMKRVSFGFRNINNYIAKMMLAFLPLCWLLDLHTV